MKKSGDKVDKSKAETKSPPQWYKQQSRAKAEAEVEVFTSTSLVNLVRLMHTYCLKLHVEEESAELQNNHTLFSQEEVWKYERPTEESDEEINVVSDDEGAAPETKQDEAAAAGSARGKLLKGVLLSGNYSPRGKKRVSFGPVHVASFDPSVEKGPDEEMSSDETASPLLGDKTALKNPSDSVSESRTQPSQSSPDRAEALPRKAEAKAKALSLQQYRQLRQKRQPLVEKQGNYTTKWPSVPEPPKELTPILCLQGHRPAGWAPKPQHPAAAAARPQPSEDRTLTPPRHSGLKRPRTDLAAPKVIVVPGSKGSPVKKSARLSIDPPNPVLLPMPVPQTAAEPPHREPSTGPSQPVHSHSSGTSPHTQLPAPEPLSQDGSSQFQELHIRFTSITSAVSSQSAALSPTASSKHRDPEVQTQLHPDTPPSPPPTAPGSDNEFPQSPQRAQSAAGIEAADLTSLLEQFEETQGEH